MMDRLSRFECIALAMPMLESNGFCSDAASSHWQKVSIEIDHKTTRAMRHRLVSHKTTSNKNSMLGFRAFYSLYSYKAYVFHNVFEV